MPITRHFIDLGQRRVHYRLCGEGPALLMVHQSPRSSRELEPQMERWSAHFTCIAPDTPGFGLSDPLPASSEIEDFADALLDFMEALGQGPVLAYGIHSGAVILLAALRRRPAAFRALAASGYGMMTAEEQKIFSDQYLPPFRPSAYGEHLTWLWSRSIEQAWFFPWFATTPQNRFPTLHTNVGKAAEAVMQMLDSGDAYRIGYGAVLRSPRKMPPPDAELPPVLFSVFEGDPLEAHILRMGILPQGWRAVKVPTQEEDEALSLEMLRRHVGPAAATLPEATDEGFIRLETADFTGLVHWRGSGGGVLHVHAPGRSLELLAAAGGLAIDLPGHGVSDSWPGDRPRAWRSWRWVIDEAANRFGCTSVKIEPMRQGDPERLFPDLAPDRFGCFLTTSWSIVRAQEMFELWYQPTPETMRDFDPASLQPERLALVHRALLRASAARAYAQAVAAERGSS